MAFVIEDDTPTPQTGRFVVEETQPQITQESNWYSPERLAANPFIRFAGGAASPILGAMELIPGDIGNSWAAKNKQMQQLVEEGKKQQSDIARNVGGVSEFTGGALSPVFLGFGKALPTAQTAADLLKQGAAVGGLAGVTSPSGTSVSENPVAKLEQGALGATLGGVLTPTIGAIGKIGYNVLAPPISKTAAEKGAAKQLIEIAGEDAKAVAQKLSAGQPIDQSQIETAAQSLVALNNPKISALQKYWQSNFGSVSAYRNELAQKDLEVARLKFLGAETAPQRQEAIDEANRVTRAFTIAKAKGTSYQEEAANLVAKVRNVEALGASAAEQAIMLDSASQAGSITAGMPRVGGRNVSRAQELIDVAQRQSQQFAEQSLRAGASARLAEGIVGSMEQRGLEPISADKFISSINDVMNRPENIVNDTLRLLSRRITNAITRASQANNGTLDAASLDALRRTAINDFIDSATRGNPSQAKKLASHETTTSFKKFIDDVIENAGGQGYKDYMLKYSTARKKIEGPLLRMEESDEMAQKGMQEVVKIMNDQKIHGLGVLERTITIGQAMLRGIKGIAGRNVGKQGAELMTNRPEKMGALMQNTINNPMGMLGDITKYQGGVLNSSIPNGMLQGQQQ